MIFVSTVLPRNQPDWFNSSWLPQQQLSSHALEAGLTCDVVWLRTGFVTGRQSAELGVAFQFRQSSDLNPPNLSPKLFTQK
eukprot:1533765-Amphidinium_carterae.1